MFSRVLIANRGEIAVRIIRTCKRLGVETVAIYSEADRDSIHTKLADRKICVGPAPSSESYLNELAIIAAAETADVEAIHPGYGFLAENAHFAELVRSCRIEFIGPPSSAMEMAGDKARVRGLAKEAGVPVVPGSDGVVETTEEAVEVARKVGYPVIIKAAAGGGGRGMRMAHNDVSMQNAFMGAKAEAESAFGDGRVYVEKYVEHPRHIEIQILADAKGHVVHLGERDCSIQRRHQKLIEESPSPFLDKQRLRTELGRAAVALMKKVGYQNAGTVEFILDKEKRFYFIEVNARIQVEHPVTELVTGIDIVEEQLRIASGEPLRYRQKNIRTRGWAIECRINAEDVRANFAPSPGRVSFYYAPVGDGVRIDSHVYCGYVVPREYDSLLAKAIVHGKDRTQAIEKMKFALDQLIIEGCPNTVGFCKEVLKHAQFIKGDYDTHFVETFFG